MSTLQHINSSINYHWPEMSRRYPGFEKPQIVPAATLRGMAPAYLMSAIDNSKDSFFLFIAGDPTKGDCSRDQACRFFDELFYEKLQMPSSYDVEAGGDYPREQAIDMEVLPPARDRQFRDYYDEQMAKMNAQAAEEERRKRDDEFERRNGFRPDDPDIIDVGTGDEPKDGANSTAVGAAKSTAVGMPKKIFYCVDFHCPAGQMLGYDRGSNRLSGRDNRWFLREGEGVRDVAFQIIDMCVDGTLAWEDVARGALDRMSSDDVAEMAEKAGWIDADELDECDKCGDDSCKAGEKCGLSEGELDESLSKARKIRDELMELRESADYAAVSMISQSLHSIESAIQTLTKTINNGLNPRKTSLDEDRIEHVEGIDNCIKALDRLSKAKPVEEGGLDEFEPEEDGSEYYGKVLEKLAKIEDEAAVDETDVQVDEDDIAEMIELGKKIR